MPDTLRAVTKTYDFTLWLLPHLAKFSRDHRFTLGNRLEEGALEVLELLVEASCAGNEDPRRNPAGRGRRTDMETADAAMAADALTASGTLEIRQIQLAL